MNVTNPPIAAESSALRKLRRHSPTVKMIVRAWRGSVGSEHSPPLTMVACSGGADSCALAVALASATRNLIVAHVLHDMRPREHALADRDAARALAGRLAIPFVQADVCCGSGNSEAGARRARYRALTRMALTRGASFVATAHHADDQLESMLMALVRGAGPAGLRGVAEQRALAPTVTLIRPMLSVTRAQARGVCEQAAVTWQEDQTNTDTARLRAALRHGPLADLAQLRPHGAVRAAQSAALLRDAMILVEQRTRDIFGEERSWSRALLRPELPVVLGEGLRCAAERLLGNVCRDRLTTRVIDPVVRAIRAESTDPRSFDWPGDIRVSVRAKLVTLCQRDSA